MQFERNIVFWVATLAVLAVLLWLLSPILLPFVLGMAIAYLLDPLAKELTRRGMSRLVAAMPEGNALAYNSVLTTIRILEQKGYVQHRKEGRAFFYIPLVAEEEAGFSEVRLVLRRFFGDSREKLMLSLLGDSEITAEELQRLRDAIQQADEPGRE